MRKKFRSKKFFIFFALLLSIFITTAFSSKAIAVADIPDNYFIYNSNYNGLLFGTQLNRNVYFNTDNAVQIPVENWSIPYEVDYFLNASFTYLDVEYNALHFSIIYNEHIGSDVAQCQFFNTNTSNLSYNILFGEVMLGDYSNNNLMNFTTEFKNASPSIIMNSGSTLSLSEGTGNFWTNLFFGYAYITTIDNSYNLSLGLNEDDTYNINTYGANIYYSLDDGATRHSIIENDTLPVYLGKASSVRLYNYINTYNSSLPTATLTYSINGNSTTIMANSMSSLITLTEDTIIILSIDFESPPPTDEDDHVVITGGYKFNDTISCPFDTSTNSSYTMDLTSFYNYFPYSTEPEYINYQYLYFDVSYVYLRSSDYSYYYIGTYNDNENVYQVMNNNNRYFRFDNVSVSKAVYDYLVANGTFGTFEQPQVPSDDWQVGSFLLNGLNNFLSFEIYPGFSLISLLNLIVAIPLLIYILKLFLGG